MCVICHQTPCHPQCPNAPESKGVFVCSGCGDYIYGGDWYYEVLGEQFCKSCMDECYTMAEAEEDEYDAPDI